MNRMQQQEWPGKKFILNAIGAGTAIMFSPLLSWGIYEDDSVAKIAANTMGIDTHNHIDVPLNKSVPQ
jgi:membrane dipeptidase